MYLLESGNLLMAISRQIPGAQLAVIDDAGHAVFADQPEKFNQVLAEFLARLDRPAGRR